MSGSNEKIKKKRLSVLAMVLIDIGLYVVCMGSFLLYFYVLPHHSGNAGKIVAQVDTDNVQFDIGDVSSADSNSNITASDDSDTSSVSNTSSASEDRSNKGYSDKKPSMGGEGHKTGNTSNENTSSQDSDINASENIKDSNKTTTQIQEYSSDKVALTVNKVTTGSGSDQVTYYVTDVKVSNISCLRTGFASGEYG